MGRERVGLDKSNFKLKKEGGEGRLGRDLDISAEITNW